MKDGRLASFYIEGSIAPKHKGLLIGHGLAALSNVLHPDLCYFKSKTVIDCRNADRPVQLCSCNFTPRQVLAGDTISAIQPIVDFCFSERKAKRGERLRLCTVIHGQFVSAFMSSL